MRKWWTDEMKGRWKQPKKGDLVYLIGSISQRIGGCGVITKVYPAPHSMGRASVLWPEGYVETNRSVNDLEVINEST